ncbi:MAG TPA: Do family serine endopeptidase [Pseudomonadales bacterium]|nr:Do family serine endopeptidase [Pseudomonadales bacterium]
MTAMLRDRLTAFMSLFTLVFLCAALAPAASAAGRGLPDFTDLVDEQSAAVVNISTVSRSSGTRGLPPGMSPDDLPEFFRYFFRGNPPGGAPGAPGAPQPERRSLGSGFILSEDGYILTNNHVVDGADQVFVRLVDRREFEATLVGRDPRSDLALLKVEADDLPTVRVGRSEELEVGEWVLAIGSPFGFDYSVTAGIVSAKGRSLPDENNENYVPYIQTDVAINPGNSGGPLFDLDGRVVGINSQIYTRSGGFMGLSFAIPIDIAMDVVEQIKETGYVARGYLGVQITDVDRDLAEALGLDTPSGALVADVVAGSPAEEAGIQVQDVILEFDGIAIDRSGDLPHAVGRKRPGYEAKVLLVRDGKRRTLKVEVGELAAGDTRLASAGAGPAVPQQQDNALAITVEPVPEPMRQRFGVEGGVVVTEVGEGPGADARMRPGDIITRLDNKPIDSVEAFAEVVEALPKGRSIPVLIVRGGVANFIVVRIPED